MQIRSIPQIIPQNRPGFGNKAPLDLSYLQKLRPELQKKARSMISPLGSIYGCDIDKFNDCMFQLTGIRICKSRGDHFEILARAGLTKVIAP